MNIMAPTDIEFTRAIIRLVAKREELAWNESSDKQVLEKTDEMLCEFPEVNETLVLLSAFLRMPNRTTLSKERTKSRCWRRVWLELDQLNEKVKQYDSLIARTALQIVQAHDM